MGSYVFRWEEPANEVLITGTFDNWAKSTPLKKENGIFQRQVDIPNPGSEVLYKYIVDGKWAYDKSKKSADDGHGNTNNVLHPSELTPLAAGGRSSSGSHPEPVLASALLSGSAGPQTTTSELAGKVPKMGDSDMPGAFPGSDAAKAASKGEEQTFGVAPLPATAGAGNPISVKPGEKLPPTESITSNTTQSHVKLDRASYEKSDAYPLAGVGATASGGPPDGSVASDPTISSAAGSNTTTAALAGQVPKESDKRSSGLLAGAAAAGAATLGGAAAAVGVSLPTSIQNTIDSMNNDSQPASGVPETVKESQEAAHTSPEASANPTAVTEKSAVERELTSTVHPTSEAADAPPTTTAATSATAPGDSVILDDSTAPAIAVAHGAPAHNEEPVHATSPQDSSFTSKATAAVAGAAAAVGATAATATGVAAVKAGPSGSSDSKDPEAFKNDPTHAVDAFKGDPTSGPTQDPIKTTPVKAFEGDPVSSSHKLSHEPEPEGVTASGAGAGAGAGTSTNTGTKTGADTGATAGAAGAAGAAAGTAGAASSNQTSTGWKEGSEPKNRSELLKDAEKARTEKAAAGTTDNTGAGKGESATGAGAPSGVAEASKDAKKKNRRSLLVRIKDKIKGDHSSEKK